MNVHKYTDAKKHTLLINNNAPLMAVIGLFMGLTLKCIRLSAYIV
jgi:hypothetical protein